MRLLVHHSPLVSRALVADWGAGDISDVGGQIPDANADLTVDLPPGDSVAFTIRALPGTLGLTMDYASIGITLEALGDDGTDLGTHRLGLLRTFLTWQIAADYLPLKITWLMPLTGGPTSATGGPPSSAELAAAVAPQTRLSNVLAAIQAAPARAALSVAIDPSLVADLESRATVGRGKRWRTREFDQQPDQRHDPDVIADERDDAAAGRDRDLSEHAHERPSPGAASSSCPTAIPT